MDRAPLQSVWTEGDSVSYNAGILLSINFFWTIIPLHYKGLGDDPSPFSIT
jgi:hypothetical protein